MPSKQDQQSTQHTKSAPVRPSVSKPKGKQLPKHQTTFGKSRFKALIELILHRDGNKLHLLASDMFSLIWNIAKCSSPWLIRRILSEGIISEAELIHLRAIFYLFMEEGGQPMWESGIAQRFGSAIAEYVERKVRELNLPEDYNPLDRQIEGKQQAVVYPSIATKLVVDAIVESYNAFPKFAPIRFSDDVRANAASIVERFEKMYPLPAEIQDAWNEGVRLANERMATLATAPAEPEIVEVTPVVVEIVEVSPAEQALTDAEETRKREIQAAMESNMQLCAARRAEYSLQREEYERQRETSRRSAMNDMQCLLAQAYKDLRTGEKYEDLSIIEDAQQRVWYYQSLLSLHL